ITIVRSDVCAVEDAPSDSVDTALVDRWASSFAGSGLRLGHRDGGPHRPPAGGARHLALAADRLHPLDRGGEADVSIAQRRPLAIGGDAHAVVGDLEADHVPG